MAEKRYKITSAVVASQSYASEGNQYSCRIGFDKVVDGVTVVCNPRHCPIITCDDTDVLGTTNEWAQRFMDTVTISPGITINGLNFFGVPGSRIFEETSDPVTIDLDSIFPS